MTPRDDPSFPGALQAALAEHREVLRILRDAAIPEGGSMPDRVAALLGRLEAARGRLYAQREEMDAALRESEDEVARGRAELVLAHHERDMLHRAWAEADARAEAAEGALERVREVAEGLRARARVADKGAKNKGNPPRGRSRREGKAFAYAHAAEIMEDALALGSQEAKAGRVPGYAGPDQSESAVRAAFDRAWKHAEDTTQEAPERGEEDT